MVCYAVFYALCSTSCVWIPRIPGICGVCGVCGVCGTSRGFPGSYILRIISSEAVTPIDRAQCARSEYAAFFDTPRGIGSKTNVSPTVEEKFVVTPTPVYATARPCRKYGEAMSFARGAMYRIYRRR
jgi:hypothetical protein